MMKDVEIDALAKQVFQQRAPGRRLIGLRVQSEEDFNGDQVVRVFAETDAPVLDPRDRLALALGIEDAMAERDDRRSVILAFGPVYTPDDLSDDDTLRSDDTEGDPA